MDSRRLAFVSVLVVVAVVVVAWRAFEDPGGQDAATGDGATTSLSATGSPDTTFQATTTTPATSSVDPTTTSMVVRAMAAETTLPSTTTVPGGSEAPSGSRFADLIVEQFEAKGLDPARVCDVSNRGVDRVLSDYGAVFVAQGVVTPPACIFADNDATDSFQQGLDQASATIGEKTVTVQRPAMESLQEAIAEASSLGLSITPRGSVASARSFDTSEELWLSRVEPALDRYVSEGRISKTRAEEIRSMDNLEQIAAVLELESQGLLFGLNQAGSIMSSVAPPGSTQHHSLLALDVAEYDSTGVRDTLARHGWFQTILNDEPHFTYLGVPVSELPPLGLRAVEEGPYVYWVPAR